MRSNISTVAIFTRDIDGLGTPAVGFGPASAIYTGAVDDRIDLVRRWIDESRTIIRRAPGSFPLKEGTTVPLTLKFERAGEVKTELQVRPLVGGEHHHSH